LPPTLPVLAAVVVALVAVVDVADVPADVVFDEVPPHAVTTTHTAANDTSHVKRFIDILRSLFDDRQRVTGWVYARFASRVADRAGGSSPVVRPELVCPVMAELSL
jgi:hypothetical protein